MFFNAGEYGFKTRYLLSRESFIRLVMMGSKHGTYSIESFYEAGNDGFKTRYLLNRVFYKAGNDGLKTLYLLRGYCIFVVT